MGWISAAVKLGEAAKSGSGKLRAAEKAAERITPPPVEHRVSNNFRKGSNGSVPKSGISIPPKAKGQDLAARVEDWNVPTAPNTLYQMITLKGRQIEGMIRQGDNNIYRSSQKLDPTHLVEIGSILREFTKGKSDLIAVRRSIAQGLLRPDNALAETKGFRPLNPGKANESVGYLEVKSELGKLKGKNVGYFEGKPVIEFYEYTPKH